ncbi:uncharacterized protein LOC103946098 isoform X2 [Pyrus x bretschneideri]|uniref:uncharacterized protein LOC103946098 isoform X2 n=1 Tax=Pyrus x bretschneideri TaxID=225117 RepID=UPI00202E93CD|nr:uncharacterized protein LOC103946098 isoform X2 [Pyrus x bretschneideri]
MAWMCSTEGLLSPTRSLGVFSTFTSLLADAVGLCQPVHGVHRQTGPMAYWSLVHPRKRNVDVVSGILSSSTSHARLWLFQLKPKRVSVLRKSKEKGEPLLEDLPKEYYDDLTMTLGKLIESAFNSKP